MGISAIFGNPFSTAFSMTARTRLIAINSGAGILMPSHADNEIIPVSSGPLGFLSKAVDFSAFALLIPGLMATPIGAAIFGAVVLNGLLKSVNSTSNLVGSILSFDLMGILTNGLATAGNLITVLPMGKLFSNFSGTMSAIQKSATAMGGGTRNYILAGAKHLYGHELAFGANAVAGRTGGMRALLFPQAGSGVPATFASRNPGFAGGVSNWWG